MEVKDYLTRNRILAFLKFFVAALLFVLVKDLKEVNSFSTLIVALLEFIIVLEIVRMLIGFLFSDENNIKLRFMIDSTIIFFIRDIMLIANSHFDFTKIGSVLVIIAVLFLFRGLTIKFSPSNTHQ
ncbi:phosphate-starvation-inducible PsiE family protein [Sulfurospirillum sp. 1612]|uniref:phosphate-starvation-inducible PsiE family protein n=1 Tax=Sulfurospirillum sp. 1612 TaxID=3094835 RepID=UPI002F934231